MLWLGQPCALHALRPGDLLPLRPLCRSVVLGETTTGRTAPAALALVGLLSGRGEPGKEKRPRSLRPSGRRCALRQALRTSRGRFWFPFGAESPGARRVLRPPLAGVGPDPLWLHAQMSLQAVGSDLPAGGESSGSRKGTGGSPANDPAYPSQEDGQKPNKSQQLKKVFKEYGGVAVAFHVGISLMSLGMFYLALSSGVDMTAILFKLGFDEAVVQSKLAAGTSTFLLAYAIHKLFAPVRISITLISVPLLVRYFRKIGFFKPPAPKP